MPGLHAPLDAEAAAAALEKFRCDGYVVVPGVLAPEECAAMRARVDELYATPGNRAGMTFVRDGMAVASAQFRDLYTREPILSLVRAVLGAGCRFCGGTMIRNEPGTAITLWHVDDHLEIPLPPAVPRHDARMTMPVLWLTVQVALSPIDTVEDGPSEVVPGSHYSGRQPSTQDGPRFEGRSAQPILCAEGDVYLFNHQTWHRGGPNRSQRVRYLLQLQYARGGLTAMRFQGLPHALRADPLLRELDDNARLVLGLTAPAPD